MTNEQVARLVSEAFAGVPAPAPAAIAHCEQCELWVARFLVGLPSHWNAIAADDLAHESAALASVTPEAWRFLLPAYMTWHLKHYRDSSSNTVDNLVYQLTRSDSSDPHIIEGYELLSEKQVRAVAAFLTVIANQSHDPYLAENAQRALDSYWRDRAA